MQLYIIKLFIYIFINRYDTGEVATCSSFTNAHPFNTILRNVSMFLAFVLFLLLFLLYSAVWSTSRDKETS